VGRYEPTTAGQETRETYETREAREVDAALVVRAAAGDAEAFGQLVHRHLRAAYGVARAIVGEPADAEDVCQDTFVAVLAHIEECQPPASFRGWLLRSVRNRAISFRRWQRVRTAAALGTAPGEVDLPAAGESPHAAAERAELGVRLTSALATLSDRQRAAVLLHDVEGRSHREIGERLGIAEGTSRAALFTARRRLRTELGPEYGPASGAAPARLAG
jgi:RNA polymerase sigma-70 factor (ECF subfamily)